MRRPLSIKIIAAMLVIGGVWSLCSWGSAASGGPFSGLVPHVYTIIMAIASLCLGVGLWQLKEWARLGTIGYEIASFIFILVILGSPETARFAHDVATKNQVDPATLLPSTKVFIVLIGAVPCFLPIWFLIKRKEAFSRKS